MDIDTDRSTIIRSTSVTWQNQTIGALRKQAPTDDGDPRLSHRVPDSGNVGVTEDVDVTVEPGNVFQSEIYRQVVHNPGAGSDQFSSTEVEKVGCDVHTIDAYKFGQRATNVHSDAVQSARQNRIERFYAWWIFLSQFRK